MRDQWFYAADIVIGDEFRLDRFIVGLAAYEKGNPTADDGTLAANQGPLSDPRRGRVAAPSPLPTVNPPVMKPRGNFGKADCPVLSCPTTPTTCLSHFKTLTAAVGSGTAPIWFPLLTSIFMHCGLAHLGGKMLYISWWGSCPAYLEWRRRDTGFSVRSRSTPASS